MFNSCRWNNHRGINSPPVSSSVIREARQETVSDHGDRSTVMMRAVPNFQQVRVQSVTDPPWQRSSYGHAHTAHYTISMLMLAFHPAQLLARLSTDVCELFYLCERVSIKVAGW